MQNSAALSIRFRQLMSTALMALGLILFVLLGALALNRISDIQVVTGQPLPKATIHHQ